MATPLNIALENLRDHAGLEVDFPPRSGAYQPNAQRRGVWESLSALVAR